MKNREVFYLYTTGLLPIGLFTPEQKNKIKALEHLVSNARSFLFLGIIVSFLGLVGVYLARAHEYSTRIYIFTTIISLASYLLALFFNTKQSICEDLEALYQLFYREVNLSWSAIEKMNRVQLRSMAEKTLIGLAIKVIAAERNVDANSLDAELARENFKKGHSVCRKFLLVDTKHNIYYNQAREIIEQQRTNVILAPE